MKIESSDNSLDQLLKGSTFFIPRFQRPYSWEMEHISAFWDDITENLSQQYFIGSMVVYNTDRSTLSVVDGQQRLTTITILLCAIREAYKSLGHEALADGLQAYIEQKDRENKKIYVLNTETSFPFLQEEVLKSEPADVPVTIGKEEQSIQVAFDFFKGKIGHEIDGFLENKEQSDEDNNLDAKNWLSKLRDTVFDLNIILVALDNEDDAYLIFETLNTRGKDLALSDLLRNHFSKFLKPQNGVDQTKLKWAKVVETISSSEIRLDPDQFIVHSWQSRYEFVTKAKTFSKIKERVVKKNAKSHLDRFMSDAECWRSIFDTSYVWKKDEREAQRSLEALRIFKVVQPTPGVLSLVRSYRDKKIKYRVFRNALSSIENFHFAFNAVTSSRSSGGISGMYSSFGKQVYNSDDSNQVAQAIRNLVAKLREREVASSEFDAAFEQILFTNALSSQKPLVQYILKNVAKHEGMGAIGHTDDLTIEHLLPQKSISEKIPEYLVGQIGNLLLVDSETNELLGTKPFQEKKKILTDRGYNLPEILMDAKKITPELIQANTYRISKLARESIWKV